MPDPTAPRDDPWPDVDPELAAEHEQRRHEQQKHDVGLLRRVYALLPIIGVLYLSYRAIAYLIVALLVEEYAPPKQFTQIPARLTAEVWRTAPDRWLGSALAESPRAPLSHYHQIDGWFQPDAVNDCTRAGCHSLMPHSRHKEVRAFLNMHATSLHCAVCHLDTPAKPLPLVWYNLKAGAMTDPPALLQAYGWLESDAGAQLLSTPTADGQKHLVRLLEQAAAQAGDDPSLTRMAQLVAGPRYTSRQFLTTVANVRARLPSFFRGEYGAKLTLRDQATGRPIHGHPGVEKLVREFIARGDQLNEQARDDLLGRLHPARRSVTLQCTDCHRQEGGLVDLAVAGYPPQRIATLQQGWIFRAIDHIMEGNPLNLPGFLASQSKDSPVPPSPEPPEEP